MVFQNPIWVTGDIKPGEFYIQFTRRFSELVQQLHSDDVITVFINSRGGDMHTAIGVYDLLQTCRQRLTGIVAGRAESGASLALQACDRRLVTQNSILMLHKSHIEISGSLTDGQSMIDSFRELEARFYEIYRLRSGRDFDALQYGELRLNAHQAVELGLADAVISSQRPSPHQ